jgi:serine/threonine protein kinase
MRVQVLRSLAFLHRLDLIHCDLKPENIMIAEFERPRIKIIDLGSSCFVHDRLATYVQSRSYRAPEVILKAGYDGRIDVWSLGAILAELVMGSVLFTVRIPHYGSQPVASAAAARTHACTACICERRVRCRARACRQCSRASRASAGR